MVIHMLAWAGIATTQLLAQPSTPDRPPTYLSDIRNEDLFGLRPPNGGLIRDRSYDDPNTEITIAGKSYPKGIVTHALDQTPAKDPPNSKRKEPAWVDYWIDDKYEFLEAVLGLTGTQACPSESGSVIFSVFDREIAKDLIPKVTITGGSTFQRIRVPIKGVKVLRLQVDDAGDGHGCDHAAWGDAKLVPQK